MIKVIAIGNILMGDDGVALRIIDAIEGKLNELNPNIRCIKAETDLDYALDNIEDGDSVFILDSASLGIAFGKVFVISLEESERFAANSSFLHNLSLVSFINKAKLNINGVVIGIEVEEVGFSLELSENIKASFQKICLEVYEIIKENIKMGVNYA